MPKGAKSMAMKMLTNCFCIDERDIKYLDLRQEIKKDGIDWVRCFLTDHNWTPRAAIWAAEKLFETISHELDIEFNGDLYDLSNYNIKLYEDWFLGSLGKRTGKYYAGVDDIELITPKFETSFDFFAVWEEGEVKRKGNFEDVMFDMSQLSEKDYYALSAYSAYIGYDYAYNTIVNNDAPNDIKILLLRDSYSCAMLPFLSINAKEITAVDLRHYDGNVSELVENGDFDVVLIAYNPYVIMKTMFDFGD
ncbi:MAG: DHHW family protein [Anaerovoracaceae bacterium]